MRALTCLFLLIAIPALAEDFALREGDATFAPETLEARLSGQVLTFYDNGQSEYYTDGRYSYTYADEGGTAYGYWSIAEDGSVCIAFVNGFGRCDLYVENAGRLILIDEKGDRYPVRP